jgi:hypothetical protein
VNVLARLLVPLQVVLHHGLVNAARSSAPLPVDRGLVVVLQSFVRLQDGHKVRLIDAARDIAAVPNCERVHVPSVRVQALLVDGLERAPGNVATMQFALTGGGHAVLPRKVSGDALLVEARVCTALLGALVHRSLLVLSIHMLSEA